ncbi:hypothetical protein H206_00414 [Candidatus Electrothrix aarhusensis]|uniref:Uncharacterized protein n=1 Tax=Candidatus Electrothrix aarhusensis TaxID=1859131 RepID=A0A3S3U8H5_9BACT|nr:hypothetical protein H206_00414 [Candidatus Electrothrix aarhusensis]
MKKIIIRFALGLTATGLLMASSASAMQVDTNTGTTAVDQLLNQTQKVTEKKRTESVNQVIKDTLLFAKQIAEKKRADSVAQVTRDTLLLTALKN